MFSLFNTNSSNKNQNRSAAANNRRNLGGVQYRVEQIDVDDDGVPDGDMVTKIVNGKVVSRKFVPFYKLAEIANNAVASSNNSNRNKNISYKVRGLNNAPAAPSRERIVYKNMPAPVASQNKPVIVQERSGFGEYLKMGAGMGAGAAAGSMAVHGIADGLGSLFSGSFWNDE